jgi:hypothetical protein
MALIGDIFELILVFLIIDDEAGRKKAGRHFVFSLSFVLPFPQLVVVFGRMEGRLLDGSDRIRRYPHDCWF